jgi:predicted CXXCH cytochrome family protein
VRDGVSHVVPHRRQSHPKERDIASAGEESRSGYNRAVKAQAPRLIFFSLLISTAFPVLSNAADTGGYLGTEVCAGCHQDIAKQQRQTNMARTWRSISTDQLPPNYSETKAEGPEPLIQYAARRTAAGKILYRVQMPGQPALEFPVEGIIGGTRHGYTFLFRVPAINGAPLPRAPLIEGRYIHSVLENGLALELGFPEEKPINYETGFGRVLTPKLEENCLECHTAPRTLGARVESGVACENCHGPGERHLAAVRAHSKDPGILNPARLPVTERWRPCSQCHEGSGFVEDPLAVNLLISDQITGLKNSECWRQSGGQMTCVNCHDPHRDETHSVVVAKSEMTCLRCHSARFAR